MSSARRYQDDLKRILGIDDTQSGLGPAGERQPIKAARGIYMIGSERVLSGSAGGEDDETGEKEDPITPDEDSSNQNSDGSGAGGAGTDPGSTDGDDFITDPDRPPLGVDVNDSTFGGGWATGGPKSFVDCETGQCIELVEVGGYVPPEGWDDANVPPVDPEWQADEGVYWAIARAPATLHRTKGQAKSRLQSRVEPVDRSFCEFIDDDADLVRARYAVNCNGGMSSFAVALKRVCPSNSPSDDALFCGTDYDNPSDNEIPNQTWPSDDCIQLAPNADGNWAASIRESPDDMIAKYSEPKSTLELCTPSGEIVDVYQRVDGGHVYFNRDQGIWAGSDSSGRMRSFGSSSTLNQEIARPRN